MLPSAGKILGGTKNSLKSKRVDHQRQSWYLHEDVNLKARDRVHVKIKMSIQTKYIKYTIAKRRQFENKRKSVR